MPKPDFKPLLAALAMALVLSGCWSDDDDDPKPAPAASTGVPASATQSTKGLVDYLNELIATMTNDTSEPVVVGDAVLPVDDTTELN